MALLIPHNLDPTDRSRGGYRRAGRTRARSPRFDYEEHGAEEYYIAYPEHPAFVEGWVRNEEKFVPIADIKSWVSPRLGIRFDLSRGTLQIIKPDATRSLNPIELSVMLKAEGYRAEQEAKRAARLAAKRRELGLDAASN